MHARRANIYAIISANHEGNRDDNMQYELANRGDTHVSVHVGQVIHMACKNFESYV